MRNLWSDTKAATFKTPLEYRVYTSNLLGQSDELVLHGGGNTSVKDKFKQKETLFVKGSGWDLVSIKQEGFSPVELRFLEDMARLESLSDKQMVDAQKEALLNKTAPNPSVEAILHAIIPFKYVDHTHSDAIVTISNSVNGVKLIEELFSNFLIVPYIMPGFILAHSVYSLIKKNFKWDSCEGIILHNHGIFTFDNNPKISYTKMIDAVTKAENFLKQNATLDIPTTLKPKTYNIKKLQDIIAKKKGYDLVVKVDQSPLSLYFASQNNLKDIATKGVLTPEHIIRTKRVPLVLLEDSNIEQVVQEYIQEYKHYFNKFCTNQIMLNPAPNYAVIKNFGIVSFGKTQKEVDIINDIVLHTIKAILKAELLGGYKSISLKDSFDMEYWELEQVKLKSK
jgi:rhamnose utilization protein RhaD (predicted bifunctional aldolase and dehydrogenase)